MTSPPRRREAESRDEGYLLLGLVVVCFLLLLTLAIAAPRVAKQLERDREVESEHRAQEYVRAIQLYYRKNHRFPSSVEELLGTGTTGGVSSALKVKYLRQQYKDPLTNGDYRLIQVGKAKTEVKGFFGEPLPGTPTANLGSVAGMQSGSGFNTPTAGSTTGGAAGASTFGSSSFGGSSFGGAQAGATGATSAGSIPPSPSTSAGTGSAAGSSSFGSGNDASTFQGSKGAFLGVGSNAKGHGLVEWNGSENIEDWEFLYDLRVDAMKEKVSLFGGTPAANGSGSLGSLQSSGATSFGGNSSTGINGTPQSPFGSTGSTFPTQSGTGNTTPTTDPNAATPVR